MSQRQDFVEAWGFALPSAAFPDEAEARSLEVDPVYPPVLVAVLPPSQGHKTAILFIGPQDNARAHPYKVDGGDFALLIRRLTPTGLEGEWERSGSIDVGRGFFCAVRRA